MAMAGGSRDDDPDASLIGGMSREIVREGVTSMPKLFISAVLAYGAIGYSGKLLLQTSTAMAVRHGVAPVPIALMTLAAVFVLLFIESAILSSVAIAVHRLILCDDTDTGVIQPLNRRGMVFTMWIVGLRVPLFLLSAVLLRFRSGMFLLLGLLVLSFATFIWVRTSLIFPAIAIDVKYEGLFSRVAAAWRLSSGRFWRLVGSTIWAVLPLVVVVIVVALGLSLVMSFIMPVADGHSSFGAWINRINPVTNSVSAVLFAALGAAALSWNYRIATASPRPSISSG